jgi:hypothetical protein
MLNKPMESIKTQAQELSTANPRPQTFHRKWRSETWLWVTPAMTPLINKTSTANIIATHQTNVKNRHQINVQGDTVHPSS